LPAQMYNSKDLCQTDGERLIYDYFRDNLSGEFHVWNNIMLSHEYGKSEIDFIVAHKRVGIITISVKDWRIQAIADINTDTVLLSSTGEEKPSPLQEARGWMNRLLSILKEKEEFKVSGKVVTLGYAGALPYVTEDQADQKTKALNSYSEMSDRFGKNNMMFSGEFEFSKDLNNSARMLNKLNEAKYLKKEISLTDSMLAELVKLFGRNVDRTKQKKIKAKVTELMVKLESSKKFIRITGAAGNGKTAILKGTFEALINDWKNRDKRIMFMLYNRSLSTYLNEYLEEDKVFINPLKAKIITFHRFLAELLGEIAFNNLSLDDEKIKQKLAEFAKGYLNKGFSQKIKYYDYIFIDEAVDFFPEWITFVAKFLSPEGKLILVEDTSQNIRGSAPAILPGETTEFPLDENIRSRKEIVAFSNALTGRANIPADESYEKERIPEIFLIDNSKTSLVLDRLKNLNRSYDKGDIALIYISGQDESFLSYVLQKNKQEKKYGIPFNFIPSKLEVNTGVWGEFGDKWRESSMRIINPKYFKLSTIHSSKGIDFDAVVFLVDKFKEGITEEQINNLLYVACCNGSGLFGDFGS